MRGLLGAGGRAAQQDDMVASSGFGRLAWPGGLASPSVQTFHSGRSEPVFDSCTLGHISGFSRG